MLNEKELHYYFVSTLLGVAGRVTSILNNLELKPTKVIEDILTFIKKANTQEALSNSDFQNIPKNPIELLINELKNLITAKYNNCKLLTNASKLNTLECSTGTYILIIDELLNNIENTQKQIEQTTLVDIYRAVELLIPIKEQELTNEELEIYLTIRENLIKALYLANSGYTTLATKQLKQLTKINEIATSHNAMQLYFEALNIVQNILNKQDELKTYTTKTALEENINDLNLEIINKTKLHPSINNNSKYLYLLKCN